MIGLNINMPCRCENCPCAIQKKNNDFGYIGKCILQENKTVNLLNSVRPKECPLVELKGESK